MTEATALFATGSDSDNDKDGQPGKPRTPGGHDLCSLPCTDGREQGFSRWKVLGMHSVPNVPRNTDSHVVKFSDEGANDKNTGHTFLNMTIALMMTGAMATRGITSDTGNQILYTLKLWSNGHCGNVHSTGLRSDLFNSFNRASLGESGHHRAYVSSGIRRRVRSRRPNTGAIGEFCDPSGGSLNILVKRDKTLHLSTPGSTITLARSVGLLPFTVLLDGCRWDMRNEDGKLVRNGWQFYQ